MDLNVSCFFKNKILLASNIWFLFYRIHLPVLCYQNVCESEITVVLIESNNICINHTYSWAGRGCSLGAYAYEFPEPTGACSRPAGGLEHACVIHAVAKRKSSAEVDLSVLYSPLFGMIKIKQPAMIIAF